VNFYFKVGLNISFCLNLEVPEIFKYLVTFSNVHVPEKGNKISAGVITAIQYSSMFITQFYHSNLCKIFIMKRQ
jgi:hypothetical protein